MLTADDQLLEPGSEVNLIEVDCSAFGGPVLSFHEHLQSGPIVWRGQSYLPWPHKLEGTARSGQGKSPTPTLAVANIDGTIGALCLQLDDLVGAKVTVRDTYSRYLDPVNFPSGTNPTADPSQERSQTWYLEQKTSGNRNTITWQLSAPHDFQGQRIPARQITPLCDWCMKGEYRGADCGYTGTAYFDAEGKPVTDPAKDVCSGLVSTGCKPRFGANNPLPHGGFPAAGLVK